MNVCAIEPDALEPNQALRESRKSFDVGPAAAAAVAAAIAIIIQSLWIPVDADVSWLITVCERMLSGDRLYVDIFEVNPPASVWLYLPFVWLAKLLGAKPEAVVVVAFVAAGLASVAATVRLSRRFDDSPNPVWLSAALSFVALVFPMALFAQREHAALLVALPSLAALAVIAEGKSLGKGAISASGFAAGAIIVIKPYFLFVVVAPVLWSVWKRKSVSPLLPGLAAGMAVIVLYGLSVLIFARPYVDWLPAIAQTYAPMRTALWRALVGPTLYPAIFLALALLLRAPRIPSLAPAWALGAAGFLVAAFVQGKNYPNHWLPQAGLALAAAVAILCAPRIAPLKRALVGAALAAAAIFEMSYWVIIPDPAVVSAIERVAPPAPKIIGLSAQLTTGHPVTRNVGGQWVGSRPSLFMAGGARYVGLKDASTRRVYREDIQSFAADVRRYSPDVVLVDRPSKTWLMEEEAIAQAMRAYRPAARTSETEIWLRRSPAR